MLSSRKLNFNELPEWQKRGIGLYWDTMEKRGFNPKENVEVVSTRRTIMCELDLPVKGEYGEFLKTILEQRGM